MSTQASVTQSTPKTQIVTTTSTPVSATPVTSSPALTTTPAPKSPKTASSIKSSIKRKSSSVLRSLKRKLSKRRSSKRSSKRRSSKRRSSKRKSSRRSSRRYSSRRLSTSARFKKSPLLKFKYSLYSALAFFLLASPQMFTFVNNILGGLVKIAEPNGCPTSMGLMIHTIVFLVLLYFMMSLPRDRY